MDEKEPVRIAVLENEMKHLNLTAITLVERVDALHTKLDDNYVKKIEQDKFLLEEYRPLKAKVEKLNYFYVKVMAVAGAMAFTFIYLPGVLKLILESITK